MKLIAGLLARLTTWLWMLSRRGSLSDKPKALLSVYDKEGIVEFARELVALGWELFSSGGTARVLREAGLPVTDVATLSGAGALFGHRLVTIAWQIYAGIFSRYIPEDDAELARLGLPRFDLVCVDTYPLGSSISAGEAREQIIEKTDVGGPTMLYAAAKCGRIVICRRKDRQRVIAWLSEGKPDEESFKRRLAARAFFYITHYLSLSAVYHSEGKYLVRIGELVGELKYGENPQQWGRVYETTTDTEDPLSLSRFRCLNTEGSTGYVTWTDIDRSLETLVRIGATLEMNGESSESFPFIGVIVKHGNGCGAAVADTAAECIRKMVEGDPQAAMGGVVITNFAIDEECASLLSRHKYEGRRVLAAVCAPSITEQALELLKRKGGACRLYTDGALEGAGVGLQGLDHTPRYRPLRGLALVQQAPTAVLDLESEHLEWHSGNFDANREQIRTLCLGHAICATSTSNTIVLVRDNMLLGSGVGQQDRKGAARLAVERALAAGHDVAGAFAVSDSFFPFPDAMKILVAAHIERIFATKGGIRFEREIVRYAREEGLLFGTMPDRGPGALRLFYAH